MKNKEKEAEIEGGAQLVAQTLEYEDGKINLICKVKGKPVQGYEGRSHKTRLENDTNYFSSGNRSKRELKIVAIQMYFKRILAR